MSETLRLALVIGIVCVTAAIVGGRLKVAGVEIPVVGSPLRQIVLGVFGALLTLGSAITMILPGPQVIGNGPTPATTSTTVGGKIACSIRKPGHGAIVPGLLSVEGVCSRLPTDEHVWIFVSVPGGAYWPHSMEVTPIETGGTATWAAGVGVGGAQDGGKVFEISVVAANADAQTKIVFWLETMKKPGMNLGGLPELPQGVRVLDRITVVRQ